jgi:hypothetical protein
MLFITQSAIFVGVVVGFLNVYSIRIVTFSSLPRHYL